VSLVILTPAESEILIELDTVKAMLSPSPSGTSQDARLTILIRWASKAIATYCRRTFGRAEYRETLAGTGLQKVMLHRLPIEGTPELSWRGTAWTDWRIEDRQAGILWRLNGWPGEFGRTGRYGYRPDYAAPDRTPLVVDYWAGYFLPGEEDPDDLEPGEFFRLPDDIERAAFLTVQAWFRGDSLDGSVSSTSTSESEGDASRSVSVSYNTPDPATLSALPLEAVKLLRDYRL
jgi:hypothetical protein